MKKNDKEKGKEAESGRKRKRVEEDNKVETQESWRAFVMAWMMKIDATLDGLVRKNEGLKKEVREMQRENIEDWREYFWEVRKVRKDMRVMEKWVRWIVECVEEKKSEEESEDGLEDGETRQDKGNEKLEEKSEETEKEMEAEGEKKMEDKMETDKETEKKAEEEKTEEEKGDRDVEMVE